MARPQKITDQQILDAMRKAVLARGPAVPLDQVAASLGVTGPALLKRFGNRQNLLVQALLPPENPAWRVEAMKGPTDEPFEEQLLRLFRQISGFMSELVPCMSALRESGIQLDPSKFADDRGPRGAVRVLREWLEAARRKGLIDTVETETAAFSMLGALQLRAFLSHIAKEEFSPASQDKYLAELAGLVTRALGPKQQTSSRAAPARRKRPASNQKTGRATRARKQS